ncbi:MAG TPA: adenosine deaminase [Gemmatimonadaceae bacterium]|nr:adenosine deaminase [Gemmatimonadaceae bacterium]
MSSLPDRDLLRRLPKAELHCHLDGSLRPDTLLELGRALGRPMPAEDPAALAEYMRVDDARHLEDYLERFDITLSVMQNAEAIDRIAYELVADAAADGVRYIEVRFAPVLNTREGLTMPDALDAALAGMARAELEHGTVARVIVCALRNMTAALSMQAAELAVAFRHRGVVAFDLAGGEAGNPASLHVEAFRYARAHDLACTCHAGEGAGAESIRDAIHVCGANRIGHGTRLFEDPSLEQYVNDRRIPVEICLTSNVQTRATSDFASHPLRRYHDQGLAVVLNTDNRMMSGVTLTDEYAAAARHLGFTFDELADLAVRSFEYGFLPWQERVALMDRARAGIDALRTEVSA